MRARTDARCVAAQAQRGVAPGERGVLLHGVLLAAVQGEVVTVTAFTFINEHIGKLKPCFLRLIYGNEEEKKHGIIEKQNAFTHTIQDDFKKIPGSPIAYWAGEKIRDIFIHGVILDNVITMRKGLATSDNCRFLREWYEVDLSKVKFDSISREDALESKKKWFPINKGGAYRKWYGNNENVINWENDGFEIRNFYDGTR